MCKLKIEKAKRTEAVQMTELALLSKSHWKYEAKQIEKWRDELTLTEKDIDKKQVYKLVNGDKLIGFYAYYPENNTDIKLDYLFVAPEYIGQGFGKKLLLDFLKRIKKTTFERVILEADPNAEKFYERMGFQVIGKCKSSIKKIFLPIMALHIKKSPEIL